MVIKANIQKNPALGVNLKQGSGQSVTNENIINALGYTPANEADIPTKVSQLENDEKYVKSWEDLPDKPFYIEETISSVTETLFEHEIIDSASVPLSGVFYRYNFAENLNLNIEENVKYTLIVNGVEHEASGIDTHNKTLSFANVQIGSRATTLSIIQSADKTQIAYRVGSYGTYTLDVSLYSNEKTQIVHPLPEMFLPVHSHKWYDLPLTDDDKIPAIYLPETMGTEGGGMTEEQAQQLAKNTEDISKISDEIIDLKTTITLGQHTDGLIYIFIGGQPVGNGLSINGEIVEPVYGQAIIDSGVIRLTQNQTAQLGVKLSEEPTQIQTITVTSNSSILSFDKTSLEFTKDNWSEFQYVTVTTGSFDEDTTAYIVMKNSDELQTETSILVKLLASAYSVDTTIPSGAHTVTIDDFDSYTAVGADKVCVSGYNASYDNIYIPNTIDVDGVAKATILRDSTFKGNTTIKYVEIESGVYVSQYGQAWKQLVQIFMNCTSLIGVKYNGSDLTSLLKAFYGCTSLKFFDGIENQIDCTSMYQIFYGCSSLEYVQDLSKLTKVAGTGTGGVGYNQAFSECSSLKKVYGFPDAFESECYWDQPFARCALLESAVVPKNATLSRWVFINCTTLKKVEIYNDDLTTSDITTSAFQGCSGVTVYCNEGTTTHESLLSVYGSSTAVTVKTFGSVDALPSIVVWGDSTTSPNTPWICWPDRLQEKLGTDGYLVKNEAVSGEFTTSTSARQGGNAISVGAFTIPSDTTPTLITMTSDDGQTFSSSPVFSCGGSFNPCLIGDVEGTISQAGTTPQTYNFTRLASGDSVSVEDGAIVTSKNDDAFNNANNVMIVELGNNAGWNNGSTIEPSVLLNQAKLMVEHFTSKGGTKYIIFGPFSGQFLRDESNIALVKQYETLASEEFGDHFISIRQYLIDNGLEDNSLTASALDTSRMALGQIPASLIGGGTDTDIKMYDGNTVTDDSHPNAYGSNSIMLGIYAKGVALGYWD